MTTPLSRLTAALLFGLLLGGATEACAYNEAGHYYTLMGLLNTHTAADRQRDADELRLETFCTELPDLAEEFDAVTQRARVFTSLSDWWWGFSARCQSSESSHMVASQNYLHALSGAPTARMRLAATEVIQAITAELDQRGQSKARRLNLACARGMAAHLYADTFAHAKLASEKMPFLPTRTVAPRMYETGLGHARDGGFPDFIFAHHIDFDRWPQWVTFAGNAVFPGTDSRRVSRITCPDNTLQACEKDAKQALEAMLSDADKTRLDTVRKLLKEGAGDLGERKTSCNEVLATAFPDPDGRPQCAELWKLYLDVAVPAFARNEVDPTSRPDAVAHTSCSAWRCAGTDAYAQEPLGSCAVEITDKLEPEAAP